MHFPFASPVRKSQLWTLSILNSFQPIIFPHKGCEIVAFKMLKVFQCFGLESFQPSPSQMVELLRNQPLLNQEMMQSILLLWDRFLGRSFLTPRHISRWASVFELSMGLENDLPFSSSQQNTLSFLFKQHLQYFIYLIEKLNVLNSMLGSLFQYLWKCR